MNEHNIPSIKVQELKKIRDANPALILLDVREQNEWQELHIPGAVHIPKDEVAHRIQEVTSDHNAPIYIHCRSGVRSLYAAQILQQMGFKQIYSVDGGIMDWAMFGYEVEEG